MGRPKKLINPKTVTFILDEGQYEELKLIAFQRKQPMAELIREAINTIIEEENRTFLQHIREASAKLSKKK